MIPGYQPIDLYNSKPKPTGDVDPAKAELAKCGQPNGFTTNISYRAERPKEKAAAESLQQSLAKVGIKLTLKPYPPGDYFKLYAGKPDFAKANNLGLMVYGWGADWPDGFGFLTQIVDSRVIRPGRQHEPRHQAARGRHDARPGAQENDLTKREAIWGQIDKKVMEDAYVLPGVWSKGCSTAPTRSANVFVNDGYSDYDYASRVSPSRDPRARPRAHRSTPSIGK